MGQSMSSKSSSVFDFFLLRVNWLFLLCLQELRNEDENGKINQMKVMRQNVLNGTTTTWHGRQESEERLQALIRSFASPASCTSCTDVVSDSVHNAVATC